MDEERLEELYTLFLNSTGVVTDSRKVKSGSLFFALRGDKFDGNNYAVQALGMGASAAVIDAPHILEANPDLAERLFLVEDSLVALQALAREHRRTLAVPIIAIVGSNGKTTTKELVSRVLAERFVLTTTRGNLNNHIGVPLTLLDMDSTTEFAVVEMGASAQREIALLCSIAEPNYGIITNIGVEGIRKGKGELFDFLAENGGRAFVPEEDEVLVAMAAERETMATEYYSREVGRGFESHLVGDYNRYNIAAAVKVGRYFDIDDRHIGEAILSFTPDNNRSQAVTTERNRLIVDCYNANPSSMAVALENVASVDAERKVLILGDMLELGEWSAEEHRTTLRQADTLGAELYLVGGEFGAAYEALREEVQSECHTFASAEEVKSALLAQPVEGALVLIKGSRGIALERVVECL